MNTDSIPNSLPSGRQPSPSGEHGEGLLLTILGPTACGKTTFAAHLALQLDGEILSADSRQVYRGMDIGTGKDLCDYDIDGQHVPYHLIDIADAGERYNVYEFQRDFCAAYDDVTRRGKTPILCGGTGLYIESVIKGYEFEKNPLTQTSHLQPPTSEPSTSQPPTSHLQPPTSSPPTSEPFNSLTIGLKIDRDLRREKISRRLRARLDEGMVDEIRGLIDRGVPVERLLRYGLEYKFVTQYIIGELKYDEMVGLLEIAIHQFAKRQMTWFRGMEERRGIPIHWIDCALPLDERLEMAKELWQNKLAGV